MKTSTERVNFIKKDGFDSYENENGESSFDKFQLEEYKNISTAHFEANKQIGIFFRYFLLIASAPAIIFIWLGKKEVAENVLLSEILKSSLFLSLFLLAISLIGALFCFYIISFRLDSVLYARTVNGIRKYFYNKEKPDFEFAIRVLPKQINLPNYVQFHTFTIIVHATALINSIYFGLAIYLGLGTKPILGILSFALFYSIHFLYYTKISSRRDSAYLKNNKIGIDIDGVLNKHKETFCTFLKKKTGKDLLPDEITIIPVHKIPNKDISIIDELMVFNDTEYWREQKLVENINEVINELRKSNYEINIFSNRPWPNLTDLPQELHDTITKDWEKNRRTYFFQFDPIYRITKSWLKTNKIKYKKLLIEKSSLDLKNRFYYTRKEAYKYFIEDDLKNALKLSCSCEYVFLLDHPYNQYDLIKIPSNIIRVKSWKEIREKIKEHS